MFHLWFVSGFTLTISAIILQLFTVYLLKKRMERNHWLFKLYIILDSVIILVVLSWLCFGAYWRLNDHGKLCTANYLKEHGEAMLLFYQSGAIILAMCLFWFIMGLCAGYWSYYASLPIRRFNRSSVFCCLCDQWWALYGVAIAKQSEFVCMAWYYYLSYNYYFSLGLT